MASLRYAAAEESEDTLNSFTSPTLPTVVSSFDFQVENSGRTVQRKLNAQTLRLFGLHSDVNDAHRAGAKRQTKPPPKGCQVCLKEH